MKKIIQIIIFIILTFPGTKAISNDIGSGIILGEPTGITIKYWIGESSALDFAISWSFSGDDSFHLHGDYLFHHFNIFTIPKGKLPIYYGVGFRAKIFDEDSNNKNDWKKEKEDKIGVRIPLGLAYIFEQVPIDVFLEIVPILDLFPDTSFDLNAAIGARCFF